MIQQLLRKIIASKKQFNHDAQKPRGEFGSEAWVAGIEARFREALQILALDPATQIRLTLPGDVPLEMSHDFLHWARLYADYGKRRLSEAELAAVTRLIRIVKTLPDDALDGAYGTRSDEEALSHEAWVSVRVEAKAMLELFGLEESPPLPFTSSDGIIWRR